MAGDFMLGQVVVSIAGRDKGNYYIVVGFGDEPYLYLADGVKRKIEKGKKKNSKHVRPLPHVVEDINIKCQAGMRVNNLEVAKALDNILGKI